MIYPPYDTEDKRRDLLMHYLETESTIYVDRHPYLVSVWYTLDDVQFMAVSPRIQKVAAITKVPIDQWEKIDNGLCMAYLVNCVLDSLEEGIKITGGCLDNAAYYGESLAGSYAGRNDARL